MGSAPAMKADARTMAVGWRTDIEGLLCAGGVANLSAALEAVSPSIIGRLGWRSTLRLRRCLASRWRRHSLRVRTAGSSNEPAMCAYGAKQIPHR
jgi:hypothetical protein